MTDNFAMLHKLLDNVSVAVPDKVALIVEDKTYTYGELSRLTQSLAASLLERGIRPQDRVAFLLTNCLEIVLMLLRLLQNRGHRRTAQYSVSYRASAVRPHPQWCAHSHQ